MPIYEYKCPKCEHEAEKLINRSEADNVQCPVCDTLMTRRISASSVRFVGAGFYHNDYGKGKNGRK